MLEKTEGAIKNGQSRNTGNMGYLSVIISVLVELSFYLNI